MKKIDDLIRKHFKYLSCDSYLAELSDESSDDEPLINIAKKKKNRSDKQTKNKTKASPRKRKGTAKKSGDVPATGKYFSRYL